MINRVVILFTAMPSPQRSARAAADPRTVRLALELLDRTADVGDVNRQPDGRRGRG